MTSMMQVGYCRFLASFGIFVTLSRLHTRLKRDGTGSGEGADLQPIYQSVYYYFLHFIFLHSFSY